MQDASETDLQAFYKCFASRGAACFFMEADFLLHINRQPLSQRDLSIRASCQKRCGIISEVDIPRKYEQPRGRILLRSSIPRVKFLVPFERLHHCLVRE